jgi:hypothetical protein
LLADNPADIVLPEDICIHSSKDKGEREKGRRGDKRQAI